MSWLHAFYKLAGNTFAALVLPPLWVQRALFGDDLNRLHARLGVYDNAIRRSFKKTLP